MRYSRRAALGGISTSILAAVAGCTRDSLDRSGTPTDRSTGADDVEFPDGYTADGLTDVEVAERSHRDAIGEQSFTVESRADTPSYGATESTTGVEPGDAEVYIELTRDPGAYDSTTQGQQERYIYVTERGYVKTVDGGEDPSYHIDDSKSSESERYPVPWDLVSPFEFNLETIDTQGGETLLHYTSEELTDSAEERMRDDFGTNRSATLVVTADGAIRDVDLLLGVVGETDQFYRASATVTGLGETSVSEPDWVDEATSS